MTSQLVWNQSGSSIKVTQVWCGNMKLSGHKDTFCVQLLNFLKENYWDIYRFWIFQADVILRFNFCGEKIHSIFIRYKTCLEVLLIHHSWKHNANLKSWTKPEPLNQIFPPLKSWGPASVSSLWLCETEAETHVQRWLSAFYNPVKGFISQAVYILLLCVTVGTSTPYLTIFTS